MLQRRRFLQMCSIGLGSFISIKSFASGLGNSNKAGRKPIVLSTWDAGINANKGAWNVLRTGGRALDAVEQGVMITESEISCCVGLGAYPDREGIVTLDASIMDELGNCGAVGAIERIKHPISVARRVMEKTPHIFLVGEGAQMFAVAEGFPLEPKQLSPGAQRQYEQWLQKSQYKPVINIENSKGQSAFAPNKFSNGEWNHDTIGMIALDVNGNLSGSCTTSGMSFKMRGRVGDSPIIGAGLYVDNEVGAAVATGLGEEVIKICGTHLIVELMRNGLSPEEACKRAIDRIVKRNGSQAKDVQVAFIALNKRGEYGAYCIQKGFSYAVCYADDYNKMIVPKNAL
jgi:N4-(beta-N-acetylglucosaminyl)-L-asparaginase